MLNGKNGHSKKIGRPRFPWTERLENLVCARLGKGESLLSICKRKRYPSYQKVMERVFEKPDTFGKNYARARELQAERMAEEILEIADNGTNDWIDTKWGKQPDLDHINRSRLRVDSRKWVASKLLPKKYGDQHKTEVNVTAQMVVMDASRMKALQERSLRAEEEVKRLPLSAQTLPPHTP